MPNLDSYAREFWAVALTSALHGVSHQGNPTPETIAQSAALIADASLAQWAQRWVAPTSHPFVTADMYWQPVNWHQWVAGQEHALPTIGLPRPSESPP